MNGPSSFKKVSEAIEKAYLGDGSIEIYYSRTEKSSEGWREVNIHSITTDIPPLGEELVIGEDRLSPGHIMNAYDVNAKDGELRSFIIGKIKDIRQI